MAESYNIVRKLKKCKQIRVIMPYDEEQSYTRFSDPSPDIHFHEPVHFLVTLIEPKGECRAGYQPGDKCEFSRCTPAGMRGTVYHAM